MGGPERSGRLARHEMKLIMRIRDRREDGGQDQLVPLGGGDGEGCDLHDAVRLRLDHEAVEEGRDGKWKETSTQGKRSNPNSRPRRRPRPQLGGSSKRVKKQGKDCDGL